MIFSDLPSPAEAGYAKAGNRTPPRIKSGAGSRIKSGAGSRIKSGAGFRRIVL